MRIMGKAILGIIYIFMLFYGYGVIYMYLQAEDLLVFFYLFILIKFTLGEKI